MKAFAFIGQGDLLRRNVDIFIGDELDDCGGVRILDGNGVWSIVPEGEQCAPTLIVNEAHARALYEALIAYFNGTENTRTLRKDYDEERKRVDKLTDTLITIAVKS